MRGRWPPIAREGPRVERKVRAHVYSTWMHDCTTSVFQSADAAFLDECWDVGSRERAVIFRGTCNNVCLFRKHVVSVIQVYSYSIKCKTFQFALLPKIYLPSEMQAEPDLSEARRGEARRHYFEQPMRLGSRESEFWKHQRNALTEKA